MSFQVVKSAMLKNKATLGENDGDRGVPAGDVADKENVSENVAPSPRPD